MLQAKDLLHPAWKPSAGSPQGRTYKPGFARWKYTLLCKKGCEKMGIISSQSFFIDNLQFIHFMTAAYLRN